MALYKKPNDSNVKNVSDLFDNVETSPQKQQRENTVKYLTEQPLSFAEQRVRSTDNLLKEVPSVKDLAVADYLTKSEMSGAEKLVRQKDNQVPSERNIISVAGQKVDLNPASSLDKILDSIGFSKESFGSGLLSGATLGVTDKLSPTTQPEANPISRTLGSFAGSMLPWGLASKAIGGVKAVSGLSNPIVQTAVREGLAGGAIGATEGAIKGESLPDIAKTAGGYALGGAVIGGGVQALSGKLASLRRAATPTEAAPSILNDVPSVAEVATGRIKPVEAKSLQGTFKLQNTGLKNATAQYDDAIQKIQNEFKTNQLRPSEQAQIPSRLGLNVDDIVNNMAKYEGPQLKNITQVSKLKTASGLRNDNVYNTLKNVAKTESKVLESESTPLTREAFNTKYGLDRDLRGLTPAESSKIQSESIQKMLDDSGKRIINKLGTDDYKSIVKFYVNKYKLPSEIKVLTRPMKESKPAQIKFGYENGKIKSASITVNSNLPKERAIGAMRHEIAHYVDEVAGYKSITKSPVRLDPNKPKTTQDIYSQYSKGHHKDYDWFEADYLYNSLNKDAAIPKVAGTTTTAPRVTSTTAPIKPPRVDVRAAAEVIPGNTVERGLARNVRTDLTTDVGLRQNLENQVMTYERQSEKEVLKRAEGEFSKGFEEAKRSLYNNIDDIKKTENVPLAVMLAREASKRGDVQGARHIISDMAERLTDAGRLANAAKLLRKSEPASIVMYLEKRIAKINQQGAKVYGKKWKELKLSDERTEKILKLELYDEAGREAAIREVYGDLTEQMPVTMLEKLNAFRRTAMLLNPTTHLRNVVGNVLMVGLRKSSDSIGATLEKALKIPEGKRTKSIGWSKDPNIVSKVDESYAAMQQELAHGGRWDINRLSIDTAERKIFDNKFLEGASKFNFKWLELEDNFFLKRAYKDALGQYMKANKLQDVTEEGIMYAKRRALEATYKDTGDLVSFIQRMKNKNVVTNVVGEAVMPFVKTPINILKRGFEYSPAGAIKDIGNFSKMMFKKEPNKEAADVIEGIAKGMTGTAIMGLGMMLAYGGWARTKSKSPKVEALNTAAGNQPFSFNTPLGSYTLDWAQPMSLPFFMGVSVSEALKKENPSVIDGIVESLGKAGDTTLNMSVFKNIMSIVRSSSPVERLAEFPISYMEQFYPAMLGKVARSVDDTRRSTYSQTGEGQVMNRLKSKIPGASKSLEPMIDVLGNEMKNEGGPAQQFLSPGLLAQNKDNPVTRELQRLNKITGSTDFLPSLIDTSTKEYTPQQVTQMQKEMGKLNLADIQDLINNYDYQRLPDTAKAPMNSKARMISSIVNRNKTRVVNKYRK